MSGARDWRDRKRARAESAYAELVPTAQDCADCEAQTACLAIWEELTDVPVNEFAFPCGQQMAGRETNPEHDVFECLGWEVGLLERRGAKVWK